MERQIYYKNNKITIHLFDKIHYYTILEFVQKEKLYVKCECQCGTIKTVLLRSLLTGNTKSCGCYNSKITAERNTTHGLSINNGKPTRLYRIWQDMKRRCKNHPTRKDTKNYHKKGIRVCSKWHDDFSNFYKWAIQSGYTDNLTIERTDNEQGYSPNNCKWIPKSEQSKNRTSNHLITFNNQSMTLSEWSEHLNIKRSTLNSRIVTRKWPIEKALTTPVKTPKT